MARLLALSYKFHAQSEVSEKGRCMLVFTGLNALFAVILLAGAML